MSRGKVHFKPDKIFTANEAVQMMHEFNGKSLRQIAEHIEKFKPEPDEMAKMLRAWADEVEAQAIVVSLRDQL